MTQRASSRRSETPSLSEDVVQMIFHPLLNEQVRGHPLHQFQDLLAVVRLGYDGDTRLAREPAFQPSPEDGLRVANQDTVFLPLGIFGVRQSLDRASAFNVLQADSVDAGILRTFGQAVNRSGR